MLARILVVFFAVIVIAAGAAIGYFVLGDSTSIASGIGHIADPLAPMDAQDTAKQVVTVAPGCTPPLESVTRPTMSPVVTWAKTAVCRITQNATAAVALRAENKSSPSGGRIETA